MKLKLTQEASAGLAVFSLAVISPASVMSACNSSRFSYKNFITNEKTERAARESLQIFRCQSLVFSGVLGLLAYVASSGSWKWAVATFLVGAAVTEVLYWDMVMVVDEAHEEWTSKQRTLGTSPAGSQPRLDAFRFAIPVGSGVSQ